MSTRRRRTLRCAADAAAALHGRLASSAKFEVCSDVDCRLAHRGLCCGLEIGSVHVSDPREHQPVGAQKAQTGGNHVTMRIKLPGTIGSWSASTFMQVSTVK